MHLRFAYHTALFGAFGSTDLSNPLRPSHGGEKGECDMSKVFSLWSEGYAATGSSSTADFLGNFEADSFAEACDKWAKTLEQPEYYKRNGDNAYYWGCRIFDNEADARRSFG